MDDEAAYLAALEWEFSDEAADAILAELTDPSHPDEQRAAAAIRLGPFVELAETGEVEPDLSARIGETLWRLYEADDVPELVRRRCLEALVRDPDERLQAPVRAALDGGGRWRITGLFAAGFVPGFEADLRAGVESDVLDERIEAWRSVGRLELHDLEGAAVAVATDQKADRELRVAAIEALESLDGGRTDGLDALDALATDPDEDIAAAAEESRLQRLLLMEIRELEADEE